MKHLSTPLAKAENQLINADGPINKRNRTAATAPSEGSVHESSGKIDPPQARSDTLIWLHLADSVERIQVGRLAKSRLRKASIEVKTLAMMHLVLYGLNMIIMRLTIQQLLELSKRF